MPVRILAIGDVVGRPGQMVVADELPGLIDRLRVDLVLCNGENACNGSGLQPNQFRKLLSYGVDVVTLGDHAFRKSEIVPMLLANDRLIRPGNLSEKAAGRGSTVAATRGGISVGVACVLGRIFVALPADDPFAAVDRLLAGLPESVKISVVEIHAEATSEKVAMGHYLDGRVSLVFGTHTHIPTADATILPGGTAYITDLGMTGPYDSVLGRRKDRVLAHMTTAMPHPFDVASGDVRLCGVLAEIDETTGKALSVERVEVRSSRTPETL